MLVLPLKQGEVIKIGDNITLYNLGPSQGRTVRVKIGVKAPREILVLREELLGRKEVPYKPSTSDRL